jgi:hypothetical protein
MQGVEVTQESTQLYPNPTKGKITLTKYPVYSQELFITLLNSFGEVLEVRRIAPNIIHQELDLHKYPSGIYYVIVSDLALQQIIHRGKVIRID